MKTVSLLVPTNKREYQPPQTPFPIHEALTSDKRGVVAARIDLVNRSTGEVILMVDDDIEVRDPVVWKLVEYLQPGSLIMAVGRNHPTTRFFAIHRADYQRIGGFDPTLNNGEDLDFYLRAIKMDMIYTIIPRNLIRHDEHPRKLNLHVHWDAGKLRAKHPEIISLKWFLKLNPIVFLVQIVSLIYHLTLRIPG